MNHDDESAPTSVRMAWGAGGATTDDNGTGPAAAFAWIGRGEGGADGLAGLRETRDELRNVSIRPIRMTIDVDEAPASVADGYLRLHLLSGRFAAPRSINLDGIFGTLTNVAWTSAGPLAPHGLDATRIRARAAGQHLTVTGVDKFPRMTDYVVPSGVRIADASRVRLGAHLAEGTTVMHEGFCNFNAGTLGASMVEGRISAGVIVGDGSDDAGRNSAFDH